MQSVTCYGCSGSNNESDKKHCELHTESFSSVRSLPKVPTLTLSHNHQSQYSETQTHQSYCITTLKGHTSYIFSLTLAGKYLYTGSSDSEVRAWKRNPLKHIRDSDDENQDSNLVAVTKGAVKSIVVLANRLFTAHQDCKIRVWKVNTQSQNKNHYFEKIASLPTLGDRTLKLLNPSNQVQIRRHKKCTWVHHVDTVSALALSKDESLLYSVSWDRSLKLWRTSDFRCLESVSNAHDDAINSIQVTTNGDIYTGSADKSIKVWRKPFGVKKHILASTLEKHNSGINALVLSPNECLLYSGACDRSILVWERVAREGNLALLGALRGHTKAILCLAVVDDLVCSGSADKSIRVWRGDGRNYACLAVLEGHQGPVKCLTAAIDSYSQHERVSSSNYLVYSGSLDCAIRVWQVMVPSEIY